MAVTFYAPANWFQNAANPTVVASWAAGDEIFVFGATESGQTTIGTPTATGLTFSAITTAPGGGSSQESFAGLWRATAGSAGTSVTITGPRGGANGTQMAGIAAWVIGGGVTSVSALAGDNAESGYASVSAPSGGMVIVGLSDWNATNPPGKTPATGTGTATERVDTGNTSNYAIWVADWQGTTTTSATYGPNNYTSLKVAKVGAVITLPASGTNYTKTPADAVGITDSRTVVSTVARTQADPVGVTDSRTVVQAAARTVADPVGVSDAVSAALGRVATVADPVGVTDAAARTVDAARTVPDPVGASDSVAVAVDVVRAPADAVGITDAVVAELGTVVADAVGVTDTVVVEQATARTLDDPVGVTDSAVGDLAGPAGPLTLLETFALASADPHDITIPGATANVDVWLLVNTAATVATPSGWTLEASRVATMGSYVFHLPAESNPGGDVDVTLDLSGARALSAVAFESDSDDASVYASLVEPTSAASTTYGTTAHTFTARDEALAVFMFHGTAGDPPASFDVTSFDQGFVELADTGWVGAGSAGDEATRIVVGHATDVAMSADGVVVTLDTAQSAASAVGFVAFDLDPGLVGSPADPVGVTDTVATVAEVARAAGDPVGVTDAATLVQALVRGPADPVGITDAVSAVLGQLVADPVGVTDSVTVEVATVRALADPVGVTDVVDSDLESGGTGYSRSPADPVGVTDAVTVVVDVVRALADPVGITDTGSPQTLDIGYELDDPVGVSDAVALVVDVVRAPADPVGVSDAVSVDAAGVSTRSVVDPVGVSDAAAGVQALVRSAADPVGVSDAVAPVVGVARGLADTLGAADAVTVVQSGVRGLADPVGVTDSVSAVLTGPLDRVLADSVGITDAVSAVLVLPEVALVSVGVESFEPVSAVLGFESVSQVLDFGR